MDKLTNIKDKVETVIVYVVLLAIALFLGFIVLVGYSDEKYVADVVTMEGVAVLKESHKEPYMWSPRYGGRVREKYDYYATYVFRVDDKEINIPILMFSSPRGGWPDTIRVKYNPTDVSEFMFDVGPLYDEDSVIWRRSDKLHGFWESIN